MVYRATYFCPTLLNQLEHLISQRYLYLIITNYDIYEFDCEKEVLVKYLQRNIVFPIMVNTYHT